jgi:hypothetical protein
LHERSPGDGWALVAGLANREAEIDWARMSGISRIREILQPLT